MNRFLVSALALVVFATGCAATEEASNTSSSDLSGYGEPTPTPAPVVSTQVVTTSAGEVVANAAGFSLYTFDRDTTSESTCFDACATRWPAAILPAGAVLVAPYATTARPDGALQITLDGHPLYTFASDLVAGDVKGDGVGGVWHLARPAVAPAPTAVTQVVETLDGEVIGNLAGLSLYTFDPDTTTESTCFDACEAHWPPALLPEGATTLPKSYGTTTRPDGSVQLTLNGDPLYLFAGDSAMGDINGDGLGGVWHLARP